MKRINKISAGILSVSLLAIQLVHPVYAASGEAAKHVQTETAKKQTAPAQKQSAWDKSTLSFTGQTSVTGAVYATIKNGGSAMQGEVIYEVYRSEQGNPKNGEVVATGTVQALIPGETQQLSYTPDLPGTYMFKAYQRPGHPGTGELWSKSVTVEETEGTDVHQEPVRPYDQYFNSTVEGGTATFTVPEGIGKVEISFSSYVYPEGYVPGYGENPYINQTVYDNVTETYGPGTHTVHVQLPETGFWQTDLYLGPVIETLTETGHPMDKIIDADSSLAN